MLEPDLFKVPPDDKRAGFPHRCRFCYWYYRDIRGMLDCERAHRREDIQEELEL